MIALTSGKKWAKAAICLSLSLALISGFSGTYIYAKAELAQYLIAKAWQKTLADGMPHTPWPWADTWPVIFLTHEATNTHLYVLEGADGSSLAFGPGRFSGSGENNGLGELISAHRDTHFSFLKEANLNETIRLQSMQGYWQNYQLTSLQVVDSRHQPLILPSIDQLLLITCYPFDAILPGGPMRYIVQAERLIDTPQNQLAISNTTYRF